jgi:uncharacterized protein YecT (DUF1311 family)
MDMRALLLLLLMLAFPALAADPDPIDAALDACLAKPEGSSTVGMVECTGDAIRAWDKRLNEVYQLVGAGSQVPGASARVSAPMSGVPRSRA